MMHTDVVSRAAPGEVRSDPADAGATRFTSRMARVHWFALAMILFVSGAAIVAAMRTTSTTFDEIVFISAGARGFATGAFDLAPDHPPLMQYVYGLPPALAGAALPDESNVPHEVTQNPGYRYGYAAEFFWRAGNDPERMAFLGRLPAVFMALALILVTFAFTRRHWGVHAGLLAAALVAFLPDVLGHGGVAYSDVPVTLALFGGVWAIDEAVRTPTLRRGALAGILTGLALGVKISAAALVPAALLLIGIELLGRWLGTAQGTRRPLMPWVKQVAGAAAIAAVAAYLIIVLIYRGDFLLEQFRFGLDYRYQHMTRGHTASAFLLGARSETGWWYFFPVAFLFKTSAGLHALLAISMVALLARAPSRLRHLPHSGLRPVLVVIAAFGALLLSSRLNIGFRYAMPILPWVCVLAAAGAAAAWRSSIRFVRPVIVAFAVWAVAFPLSYYPHFLSFISEYGPDRDRNHTVLVDSSLDWGQGLLGLRDFMRDNDIPGVYLSYFGSAHPAGYGINYAPLASFFPLPPGPPLAEAPQWVAISATNLAGAYLPEDPYARFRDVEPDAVIANTIFVYRLHRDPAP
jgi:hypothetical protein